MSVATAIKTLLEADATLLASATGGVWDYNETGRLGISLQTTAGAYDATTKVIKPCLLIKSRSEVPDGGIADDPGQVLSTREIIEFWFYQDTGYTTIAAMKARVFALLHGKQVDGAFVVRWVGSPFSQQRDDAMGNISVERDDYQSVALKRAS